jgi:hypothetical protein
MKSKIADIAEQLCIFDWYNESFCTKITLSRLKDFRGGDGKVLFKVARLAIAGISGATKQRSPGVSIPRCMSHASSGKLAPAAAPHRTKYVKSLIQEQ